MMKQKFKEPKELRLMQLADFSVEQRAEDDGGGMVIEGYAAVYDSVTRIAPGTDWEFDEVIDAGAFDGADMRDVPLKYNHMDAVPILARTRNKSLVLTVDEKGLKIRAEFIDTTDARDMYKRIKAGLIDKMSFAFTVKADGQRVDTTGDIPVRHIMKFDRIFDVSVVDVAAYDDTEVYARSRSIAEAMREKPEGGSSKTSINSKPNYHARALAIAYDTRRKNEE